MGQFLRPKPTIITMYRLVVLACAIASAAAQLPYAGYAGHAGFAAPYPYAAHGIAPAAYAHADPVAPLAYAAPVAVAHAGLGLPEARAYALPPVRQVAEAPIVEQIVEPVEQWGYKVAY